MLDQVEIIKLPPLNQRIDNAIEIDCLRREEKQSKIVELGDKGLLEKGLVYDSMRDAFGIVQKIKEVVPMHEKLRYFCVVNYGLMTDDKIAIIDITTAITAGKLIELLQKCHKDSVVKLVNKAGEQTTLKYVVSRPVSEQVLLYTEQPKLEDTDCEKIEIEAQGEVFAEVTYYDIDG